MTIASTLSLSLFSPPPSYRFSGSPFTISKKPFRVLSCSSPKTTPSLSTEQQQVLKTLAESNGKKVPFIKTYENDLARLSLVGAVCFPQALTAAASGGVQAADHVTSALPTNTMIVDTVIPGPVDKRATVSTRLFLLARDVQENTFELRKSLPENILSTTMSKNKFAMAIKQAITKKLGNFKLVLFRPGTGTNLENFKGPSEVPESFSLCSSDEKLISKLAEVVCISARQSLDDCKRSSNLWIQNPREIVSKDSSIVINKFFEHEIVENAKNLLEAFRSMEGSVEPVNLRSKHYWWTPSAESELENIGGPEFCAWTSEYVAAYKLEVEDSRLSDVKFEGWRECAKNRWEIHLTHSQLAALADILDMYYEDIKSQPDKQLPSKPATEYISLFKKCWEFWESFVGPLKRFFEQFSYSLNIFFVTVLASAVLIAAISAFGLFYLPHLHKRKKYLREHKSLPSSETESAIHRPVDAAMSEAFCISMVKKVKDVFGWSGDIITEENAGAWIGEIPKNLRLANEDDNSTGFAALEKIDASTRSLVKDVTSYQVAFSTDGKILGILPTSQVAVNLWAAAASTFLKGLCDGRQISPGLVEHCLKVRFPNEIVLIMLLMSVDPNCFYALARPIR